MKKKIFVLLMAIFILNSFIHAEDNEFSLREFREENARKMEKFLQEGTYVELSSKNIKMYIPKTEIKMISVITGDLLAGDIYIDFTDNYSIILNDESIILLDYYKNLVLENYELLNH